MEKKLKQSKTNIHPKLKKLIWEKITQDLRNKSLLTWKNELWVLDLDSKEWYLTILAEGIAWYNQDFFKAYTNLFSLSSRQLASIIKEWIENVFEVRLTSVSRRQSNMTYIIDGMLRSEKNKWEINKRFGFSYELVNKFLNIKKYEPNMILENFIPYQLLHKV